MLEHNNQPTKFSLFQRKTRGGQPGNYYFQRWCPLSKKYLSARSCGTSDRSRAERLAKRLVAEASSSRASRSTTLARWWLDCVSPGSPYFQAQQLRRTREFSPNYLTLLRSNALRFGKLLGGLTLGEVRPRDVLNLATKLQTELGLARNTVANAVSSLTSCIRYGQTEGLVASQVEFRVRISRTGRVRDSFSTDEVSRILSTETENPNLARVFLLALFGGLRRGEIVALRPEDVVTGLGVRVTRSFAAGIGPKLPKSGKPRLVPLPPSVVADLDSLARQAGPGFLLCSGENGAAMKFSSLARSVRMHLVRAGITLQEQKERGLGLHSARHFFVTQVRPYLADPLLQKVVGHSSTAMLDRYDHPEKADAALVQRVQSLAFERFMGSATRQTTASREVL